MFKQIKSVFFWSMLYKFRKRLTFVAILLSIVLLSQWIYSDIVEYLALTKNTAYLSFVLLSKWLIILFNIALSAYLILTIFKSDQVKEEAEIVKTDKKSNKKEPLSQREKEFMSKKIRTESEILLQKKIKEHKGKKNES